MGLGHNVPEVDVPEEPVHSNGFLDHSITTWNPMYLVAQWLEPGSAIMRVSVVIILPCGVPAEAYRLSVTVDGFGLEVRVKVPLVLQEARRMHRIWLHESSDMRILPYHPKVVAFENTINSVMRAFPTKEAVARIALPAKVTPVVVDHPCRDRETGCNYIYVELRCGMSTIGSRNNFQEV